MNTLGLHAMVATADGDADAIRHAAKVASRSGYGLLELPILDPWALDTDAARDAAQTEGLELACSLGLSTETDISSQDPECVDAGVELLTRAVEVTALLGGRWLCGVLASALGKYPGPPTLAGWRNSIAAMRQVAAHAAEREVRLGLEVVNRYESNLVTTVADAHEYLAAVGSDRLWIHVDTYHALIEETSMRDAVERAGDRLGYVHVGQNDRGALDSGTVDLDGFLGVLVETGYAGPITFEGFSRATADPELADTLAIWRSTWTDGETLAAEANAYLRGRLARHAVGT